MSAKGFTPGPWAVHPIHGRYIVPGSHAGRPIGGAACPVIDRERYAQWICDIKYSDRHREEAELQANAHLIASAPTLLEALTLAASKPLAEHCTDEEWEFIRSALMTAQGEQP